ncbi:hypothetical protein B0H14DRAFT_2559644 [Mycena olivaceomarginata]|nr:hypothetical protein B0H14DRAFT_2559644 [Mycena olivaceomarginata]
MWPQQNSPPTRRSPHASPRQSLQHWNEKFRKFRLFGASGRMQSSGRTGGLERTLGALSIAVFLDLWIEGVGKGVEDILRIHATAAEKRAGCTVRNSSVRVGWAGDLDHIIVAGGVTPALISTCGVSVRIVNVVGVAKIHKTRLVMDEVFDAVRALDLWRAGSATSRLLCAQ